MADPVAVAIKQEAATRELNATLLRLEEKVDRVLAISATPAPAPTSTGPEAPKPKGK
jgi:hypothetical protein